jgi:NAD(P)-dependent dehydrogenase (short-subunit alcohol dehydrogenase family)
MELVDKVAIVTGAAVGAGRAIAERLAAAGAVVLLADIDRAGGEQTRYLIEAAGGRAEFVAADMRSDGDVAAMIDTAVTRYGGLHILVNNAGGGAHPPARFPAASAGQWGSVLDANLRGAMLATQLALEPMRRSGGGTVVNMGSTAGLGYAAHSWPEYAAAKAALIRFTACLAGLRETMDVRVNCVAPDWIGTDRAYRELAAMTPAERAATPDPIPLSELTDGVVELIRDDRLAGRVMVLLPHQPPRLMDAA